MTSQSDSTANGYFLNQKNRERLKQISMQQIKVTVGECSTDLTPVVITGVRSMP